jgi:drug/metabolite transporter (DMT)-like permease
MKYFLLFIPVGFSAAAQVLIKMAATYQMKSLPWFYLVSLSIFSYLLAFISYSFTVRSFPISVAGPVNMVAVMLVVVLIGILFLGEPFSLWKILGVLLGFFSVFLICYESL